MEPCTPPPKRQKRIKTPTMDSESESEDRGQFTPPPHKLKRHKKSSSSNLKTKDIYVKYPELSGSDAESETSDEGI